MDYLLIRGEKTRIHDILCLPPLHAIQELLHLHMGGIMPVKSLLCYYRFLLLKQCIG